MSFSHSTVKVTLAVAMAFNLAGTKAIAAPETSAEIDKLLAKNSQESVILAEAKTRKKKKNSRSGSSTEEAPSEAAEVVVAPGKTMHKAQEGKDKPYRWHAALTSQLGRKESETDGQKSGTGNYQLHLLAAYIISASIEVGPEITYSEQTTKFEEGDPSVTTEYDAGIRAAYNIGNLDKAVFIPFVSLGLGISSLNSKQGDVETKGSGTKFSVGGGLHYFVDSNVALTAELAYRTGTKKMDGADKETKTTDLDLLNLGFSLFL